MLQLQNTTPFAAGMALLPNEQGIDSLYLMVKASFDIGEQWTLSEKQQPLVDADEYWDEPDNSSLKLASDYHTGKPATDIIMLGQACTPNGQMQNRHMVHLQVGKVTKSVTIFGDREWRNGAISTAKPFNRMPLVYERAFGGIQQSEEGESIALERRNPLGVGFAGQRSLQEMDGVKLPNLEDPGQLIRHFDDTPPPACFSFIHPAWQPRVDYAGTYDDAWQQHRAPYLPLDFNSRYLNMAPADLVYPGYLQGGENVIIEGMRADGTLRFQLPQVIPVARVEMGPGEHQLDFDLETLVLQPNQLQISMIWRAALACDKKAFKIGKIQVAQQY